MSQDLQVRILLSPPMLFQHTSDKLFPKYRHLVFIEFIADKEYSTFEIEFEEANLIDMRNEQWFKLKTGNRINFNHAKTYWFDTQVWCRVSAEQWNWRSLSEELLKTIYSDEGQLLLMKREMNVTC